jgi:hypothetical protein
MAFDSLLARFIAQIGKNEANNHIVSHYGPPSRDDILHDGLVGAGETWGGILGTSAGILGGEAIGGPAGGIVGGAALGPAGTLAGGWSAHGAYLASILIRDILSHPENWTIDAAEAIVPVIAPPDKLNTTSSLEARNPALASSDPLSRTSPTPSQIGLRAMNSNQPSPSIFDRGATTTLPLPPASNQDVPGGLLGMMINAGVIDPSNPDQPAPGGLAGMILRPMRDYQNGAAGR